MSEPSATAASPPPPVPRTWWERVWPMLQLLVSLALVIVALIWLLIHPHGLAAHTETAPAVAPTVRPDVEPIAHRLISVDRQSPLGQRLPTHRIEPVETTNPLLKVTGLVIASRRPGKQGETDFWQFNSPELLLAYSAWERAKADESFTASQSTQITELAEAKESANKLSVERLEKLVKTGTEAQRDLVTQRMELLQTQIQNKKDVYQAEVAVQTAHRDVNRLALQLQQSGLDPNALRAATADMDIVSAEVPEAMLGRVALGQHCTARFYGLPDINFLGQITTVSPVLSTEQRTLRVLVTLRDPHDRLRPGMFASIGLGTDARQVLRIPATSVVHIGTLDYVLVADHKSTSTKSANGTATSSAEPATDNSGRFHLRAVPVEVTELIAGEVEVVSGVTHGDEIVTDNAILLKPVVLASLRLPASDRGQKPSSEADRHAPGH